MREHVRRLAPLAGSREHNDWSVPPSPASTASAHSTRWSATRRSTRCWSTAAARSGSSGAGVLERRGSIGGRRPRDGDRADPRAARATPRPHDADRRRPPRRRHTGVCCRAADQRRRHGPVVAPLPGRAVAARQRSAARWSVGCLPDSSIAAATRSSRERRRRARRRCCRACLASCHQASASSCSRTPPSWHRTPTTSYAWRHARRAATACRRSRSSGCCTPPCGYGPTGSSSARCGARGARARPGAEHRPRRLAVHVPRQQRPRRAPPPGDARRPVGAGMAAERRPQPPRPLHRRGRPRRATGGRRPPGHRDRRGVRRRRRARRAPVVAGGARVGEFDRTREQEAR